MALHGRFVVDNSKVLMLAICGVGSFPAFSGDGMFLNRGGCTAVVDRGPLPAGKYWIVERPSGGLASRTKASLIDAWNSLRGAPSRHKEWFALYRDDGKIDDWTWVNGVRRGNFRLHPVGGAGLSFGCITLKSLADFKRLHEALLRTSTIPAGNSGIDAYGWIEVIAIGETCP